LLNLEKYCYFNEKPVKRIYEDGYVIYNYSPLVGDIRTETFVADRMVSYSIMDIDGSERLIERQVYSEGEIEYRETWSYAQDKLEATWNWYWGNSENSISEEKYFYDEKGILLKTVTYKNSAVFSTITFAYRDEVPEY
jgi:hypothetical protein